MSLPLGNISIDEELLEDQMCCGDVVFSVIVSVVFKHLNVTNLLSSVSL